MIHTTHRTVPVGVALLLLAAVLFPESASAESASASGKDAMFVINNAWILVAAFLVFVMHLGFACLESGLTRAKNTVNILFKNTGIIAIGILTYALVGFNLMYPGEEGWMLGGFLGLGGLGLSSPEGAAGLMNYANGAYTYWSDFIFQAMFAATAATIVSGAVAERIKINGFLLFSAIYVMLIYPIPGSWVWGGGWLASLGFHDFAGSTLVHSVGGWAALLGAILLGPRIGKYINGRSKAIMGHNMPLVTIGVFLLWLGWFGFNGGSVLSADPGGISYVFVTTTLAAAAGIIGAMSVTWIVQKKPDLTMILNGCLAGLVGITAGADVVSTSASVAIGFISGVIAVFSVLAFDRIQVDDPVGAISVHLVCGIWGTLAVGIFSSQFSILTQALGVLAVGAFCGVAALGVFLLVKATTGLRVSEKEELQGLDIGEHGMEAYSGFQVFTTQ